MAKIDVPILVDWESIKDYMDMYDIVEVVRCKNCKWATNEPFNGRDAFICNKTRWRRAEGEKPEDFYCADGEREEE